MPTLEKKDGAFVLKETVEFDFENEHYKVIGYNAESEITVLPSAARLLSVQHADLVLDGLQHDSVRQFHVTSLIERACSFDERFIKVRNHLRVRQTGGTLDVDLKCELIPITTIRVDQTKRIKVKL